MPAPTPTSTTVTFHELPAPVPAVVPGTTAEADRERVVFVTNAVRRHGGLRTRAEQHRPVLAAVVR